VSRKDLHGVADIFGLHMRHDIMRQNFDVMGGRIIVILKILIDMLGIYTLCRGCIGWCTEYDSDEFGIYKDLNQR
jgi:hypothetical protein